MPEKKKVLNIRLMPAEHEILTREAKRHGLTVTQMIRNWVNISLSNQNQSESGGGKK